MMTRARTRPGTFGALDDSQRMSLVLTVVIPTRNRSVRLQRALASVQAQELDDLEIVVVDDASDDDTPQVLARAADADRRIKALRNENRLGGAATRNRGVEASSRDFVAFLDDDDAWLPNKARRQVAFLEAHPDVGAVSCHHLLVAPGRSPLAYRGPVSVGAEDLLWDNFLGSTSFCMARRSVIRDEPWFDESLESCQDWDLWIRLARSSGVAVVPEPLCRYVAHGDERITASASAREQGRALIVVKYGKDMSSDCHAYNQARLRLLSSEGRGPRAVLVTARTAPPRVWSIIIRASLAGRAGWRTDDPGRGSRRLHALISTP